MTIRLTLLAGLVLMALPLGAQTPAPPGQALTLSKDLSRLPQPIPPGIATAARPTAPDPNAIRVLLSPGLETTLVAQMVGRIATLNAALGSFVAKGKPIVTFDCSEGQARMQMAQAEHAAAKETLAVKINLRKLDAAGDLEVSMAESAVNRTTAAIALAQAQLGQCSVTAPFSGHIVKTYVKPYQGINIGGPLVDMISDGPLKLRLNVPSKLLRTLKVGTPFEVDIEETGKTYTAKIMAINARVDAVAQTIELEARIDGKPANLLAGMTGFARLPMPR
jgi:membrane fusion protein (multidrug efflux system)